MLDPSLLRSSLDEVAQRLLLTRGYELDIESIRSLEVRRKLAQTRTQELQNLRNTRSKEIGEVKSHGGDATSLMAEVSGLGSDLKNREDELETIKSQLDGIALEIPNLPDQTVPVGADEAGNVEVHRWGDVPEFTFPVKDHVELGMRDLSLDSDAGAKLSGSRFTVLRGGLATMHRALAQFMLDMHIREHGYTEYNVPVIVNSESLRGTGQLPKFEEDMFATELGENKRYLISTAEISLANLVRDQIVESDRLPIRMTAHSLCFRSEAGSHGRDTRGMIRQHQFEKVELVSIAKPTESDEEHERMTRCAELVLERLSLPYRRLLLCTGDMGFSASKTFDLEVWIPSQNTYREISSCSLCGDFQARRMGARWRSVATVKPELVHTLNGSGVAIGRALVAVMENYQNSDGSISVPKVLQPYMNGIAAI